MNVLSRKQQQFLLEHFCEGTSVRSLTRLSRHSPNTVRGYLMRFGEALAAVHDRVVRNLVRVQRVQADELWGFVYAKRDKNVSATSKRAPPDDIGAYWTWVGYDPDSKLLITWHVGDRTLPHAIRFALDLRQRLVGRGMITTGGH